VHWRAAECGRRKGCAPQNRWLQAPVILCDRDLPGKGWRETVEELAAFPAHACVILLSAVLDTYLLDEEFLTQLS
jgi:hypothetical protein